jgi:hypothetical protein
MIFLSRSIIEDDLSFPFPETLLAVSMQGIIVGKETFEVFLGRFIVLAKIIVIGPTYLGASVIYPATAIILQVRAD